MLARYLIGLRAGEACMPVIRPALAALLKGGARLIEELDIRLQ